MPSSEVSDSAWLNRAGLLRSEQSLQRRLLRASRSIESRSLVGRLDARCPGLSQKVLPRGFVAAYQYPLTAGFLAAAFLPVFLTADFFFRIHGLPSRSPILFL